jgi:hypothetical protein
LQIIVAGRSTEASWKSARRSGYLGWSTESLGDRGGAE